MFDGVGRVKNSDREGRTVAGMGRRKWGGENGGGEGECWKRRVVGRGEWWRGESVGWEARGGRVVVGRVDKWESGGGEESGDGEFEGKSGGGEECMRVVMVALVLCNPISRMVSAPISSLIGLQMYCMAVLVLIFYLNEVVSL